MASRASRMQLERNEITFVTPANAGVQLGFLSDPKGSWIPAFAGMTVKGRGVRMFRRFLFFFFFALLLLPATVSAQGLVSAAEPRAAEVGREILRAGGSAAD